MRTSSMSWPDEISNEPMTRATVRGSHRRVRERPQRDRADVPDRCPSARQQPSRTSRTAPASRTRRSPSPRRRGSRSRRAPRARAAASSWRCTAPCPPARTHAGRPCRGPSGVTAPETPDPCVSRHRPLLRRQLRARAARSRPTPGCARAGSRRTRGRGCATCRRGGAGCELDALADVLQGEHEVAVVAVATARWPGSSRPGCGPC